MVLRRSTILHRNCEVSCTCKQCDDSVGTVHSALLRVVGLTHATATHMATEETPTLEWFLQPQTPDRVF